MGAVVAPDNKGGWNGTMEEMGGGESGGKHFHTEELRAPEMKQSNKSLRRTLAKTKAMFQLDI